MMLRHFKDSNMPSDYLTHRGNCRKQSEKLASRYPSLTVVRGHYFCPVWGKQPHWWCKDKEGNIIDPTRAQFPSNGSGTYVEFDGYFDCEHCGKKVCEVDVYNNGHHVYCSYECAYNDVM